MTLVSEECSYLGGGYLNTVSAMALGWEPDLLQEEWCHWFNSTTLFSICLDFQLLSGLSVKLSSFLCKGFTRAWLCCLHSALPSVLSPLSGKLGVLTMFHPGSSNHIFHYIFLSPSLFPQGIPGGIPAVILSRITDKVSTKFEYFVVLCSPQEWLSSHLLYE